MKKNLKAGLIFYFIVELFLWNNLWAKNCGVPYRLELKQAEGLKLAGETSSLSLRLLNDSGQTVTSCNDLSILFQVTPPNSKVKTHKVTIAKGKSEIQVPITLKEKGFYRIEAHQKRLYPATLHLLAKSPKHLPEDEADNVRSASIDEGECTSLSMEELMKPWTLLLKANPKENILANGKDTVIIQAFITGDQPYVDQDVEIILDNVGGNLSSSSITIPRCKNTGKVLLTSKKTGNAIVSFIKSTGIHMRPDKDLASGNAGKVEIAFLPPVKAIELKTNEHLSVSETGTVVVRLVNEEGHPVPTVVERVIRLQVFGKAKIESNYICTDESSSNESIQVCIPPNKTEVTVQLLPQSAGLIKLEASSLGIAGANTSIQVSRSLLFFVLLGFVGLVILAVIIFKFWHNKKISPKIANINENNPQPFTKKTKILLLSANPLETDSLRLSEEFREIKESLKLAKNRAEFKLVQGEAVRPKDLRRIVLDEQPQIIHFSGHGTSQGICFENDKGNVQIVSGEALAGLFKLFDSVQCVILNACYSETQAKAIVKETPYVIGMNSPISDNVAIRFSIGFYDALGANRNIDDAFSFGVNAIDLSDHTISLNARSLEIEQAQTNNTLNNKYIPVLLKKENR